jgi:RNA polymerase sigma factor (TIGR02999 family)
LLALLRVPLRLPTMADLTLLLGAIQRGEPDAAAALLAQVYAELRQLARAKMARENPGHTLQATALVHEAWLRLGDQSFENRAHFFSAAAEAMRRILIESARRKLAARHGGNLQRTELDSINMPAAAPDKADDLLALDEALQELSVADERKARLVELRYFVGLEASEAAEVLGISKATADRDWAYARAWLHARIRQEK